MTSHDKGWQAQFDFIQTTRNFIINSPEKAQRVKTTYGIFAIDFSMYKLVQILNEMKNTKLKRVQKTQK